MDLDLLNSKIKLSPYAFELHFFKVDFSITVEVKDIILARYVQPNETMTVWISSKQSS